MVREVRGERLEVVSGEERRGEERRGEEKWCAHSPDRTARSPKFHQRLPQHSYGGASERD